MYQIIDAKKDEKTDKIIHILPGGNSLLYLDVRAGLAWPYLSAPGYFCIFGQQTEKNEFKKHKLVFFSEFESEDLRELLAKLGEECTRLYCERIFADFTAERQSYRGAVSGFNAARTALDVSVTQAPYADNFRFGTHLIREWIQDKALEIAKGTALYRQVSNLPKPEVWEDPEEQFYAVNALRYLVGAVKNSPWRSTRLAPLPVGDIRQYPGYNF